MTSRFCVIIRKSFREDKELFHLLKLSRPEKETGTIISLTQKVSGSEDRERPWAFTGLWLVHADLLQSLHRARVKTKLKPREGKSTQGQCRSCSSIFPLGALLSLLKAPPGAGEAQTGHVSAGCTPPWLCWEGGERLPERREQILHKEQGLCSELTGGEMSDRWWKSLPTMFSGPHLSWSPFPVRMPAFSAQHPSRSPILWVGSFH